MKSPPLVPLAALAGAALLAASFAWPHVAHRGPGGWTEAKAQQHAQTRAALHAGTHRHGPGEPHDAAAAARAAELQARFEAELAELEAARHRGAVGARVLWWLGAALVVLAGALHFLGRDPE